MWQVVVSPVDLLLQLRPQVAGRVVFYRGLDGAEVILAGPGSLFQIRSCAVGFLVRRRGLSANPFDPFALSPRHLPTLTSSVFVGTNVLIPVDLLPSCGRRWAGKVQAFYRRFSSTRVVVTHWCLDLCSRRLASSLPWLSFITFPALNPFGCSHLG